MSIIYYLKSCLTHCCFVFLFFYIQIAVTQGVGNHGVSRPTWLNLFIPFLEFLQVFILFPFFFQLIAEYNFGYSCASLCSFSSLDSQFFFIIFFYHNICSTFSFFVYFFSSLIMSFPLFNKKITTVINDRRDLYRCIVTFSLSLMT